ncbi:hypothetical protein AAG906_013109 [Vitis piasezkii]
MDLSTSIHTAESHTLYLEQVAAQDGSQTQISNQAADADGSQTPITCMDAALYEAAAYGRIDVLEQNTVLHIAAQFGQLDCVQYILGLNSSSSLLLKPNLKGDTPLHLVAREGHLIVVKALIDAAKRLHQEIGSGVGGEKAIMRMTNEEENTALHEAVRYHHSEVFIYGANITGYTLLYMAAERGFEDLVNLIIGTCTSPAHSGMMGRTALHAAVIRNDQEWMVSLHCAAYLGYTAIVEQLLDKSPDKSVTYLGIKDSKKTALHIAANRNHQDIVKLLLSHSQIVASKKTRKETHLHLLASYQVYDPSLSEDNRVDKMALNKDKLTALDIFQGLTLSQEYSRFICFILIKFQEEIQSQLREWEKEVVGPFSWQEAINKDSGSSKSEHVEKDESISNRRRLGETHLIVAALVATVTFAAGFTLPGGYNDNGMAILTKRAAFKAFIVTDTIAVILSVSAVYGLFLTLLSMGAMVVAFMTGLYAVLPFSSGLPIVTCIICCIFLLAFYFVFRQLFKSENE